jgi:AraC-like DNA-binding protein
MQREIIQAIAFSVPALCALACMAFMIMDTLVVNSSPCQHVNSSTFQQLRLLLILTYAAAALCWTGLILNVSAHRAFVYYHPVFFFTLMMDQVLIYRFVHIITSVRKRDRFNILHFVAPVALTAFLTVCMLVIPFEKRLYILYQTGDGMENWRYGVLTHLSGVAFIFFNAFYPVLGLHRIRRYRREIVNYSADMQRTSLNWLFILQILTLITIPVPLAGMLLNLEVFSNFWLSMQGVLPTFFIYPLLCYNLLSDNFEIMTPDDDSLTDKSTGKTGDTSDESSPDKSPVIDPKRFEKYLKDKQPYMNHKIHVSDFASALCTNDKYVSSYINRTYGMNFCRFINRCRLNELDRLRKAPQMKNRSNMDLILMAGFSSYRSYLRAKKEEDKEHVLKVE